MSGAARGMPLLSGLPPPNPDTRAETACRRCSKEFNILFARAKKCNHCGYAYCSSCADHQALAPRHDTNQNGYEIMPVCGYCIEYLTITASGRAQLRTMPIPKLREYLKAYNITPQSVLEKEDLINGIMYARMPNGCLPPDKEAYYRAHSVPNKISTTAPRPRNAFQRAADGLQRAAENLVPPTVPTRPRSASASGHRPPPPPTQTRPQAQPRAPPYATRPHPQQPAFHHPRPTHAHSPQPTPPQRPNQTQPGLSPPRAPPRPSSVPPRSPQPPPAPVPTLRALLSSPNPDEYIPSLSIHTLKAILEDNHVNSRLLLEKSELIEKVKMLVENERIEREREEMWRADEEAAEEERRREREREREEEEARRAASASAATATASSREIPPMPTTTPTSEARPATEVPLPETPPSTTSDIPPDPTAPTPPTTSAPVPPPAPPPKPKLERTGLCVVCQDEEANIVTVDCGHLALCMDCSKLIMESSRECPLCRTRIVTEHRLLRVFRT